VFGIALLICTGVRSWPTYKQEPRQLMSRMLTQQHCRGLPLANPAEWRCTALLTNQFTLLLANRYSQNW
jgi:hypothetical protein